MPPPTSSRRSFSPHSKPLPSGASTLSRSPAFRRESHAVPSPRTSKTMRTRSTGSSAWARHTEMGRRSKCSAPHLTWRNCPARRPSRFTRSPASRVKDQANSFSFSALTMVQICSMGIGFSPSRCSFSVRDGASRGGCGPQEIPILHRARAAGQFPPQRYTMVTNCLISSRMATAASRAAC